MNINSSFPVGCAAGGCKSPQEVLKLLQGPSAFVVMGSITLQPRDGNPGTTSNGDDLYMLNSLGLPNPGINALRSREMNDVLAVARDLEKPVILSIAGFSPVEYQELTLAALEIGFSGVELNLGCPNVIEGSKRKPIACFDSRLVNEILGRVTACMEGRFLSVKVSPMTNPIQILETAETVSVYPGISAVVTQNTFPNCLLYNEDGSPQIQTPDGTGWAGGSGRSIKAQALGQMNQWRRALPDSIEVWGVGAVWTGRDVRDVIRAGASIAQVGTAYFNGGAKVFQDIASEFINL